jgi:hypothetical protein
MYGRRVVPSIPITPVTTEPQEQEIDMARNENDHDLTVNEEVAMRLEVEREVEAMRKERDR